MGLNSIFNVMKKEGYVAKELDSYLLSLNKEGNDRAIDVNAPSSAGGCLRSAYYSRLGFERDGNSIDPRTRRIFNNGDGVHERLQGYLDKMGMLLMDEVPLRNNEYNIQGHTDGFLKITANEVAILEIKSINDRGFSLLKDAREDHKDQAFVYSYCAEERRQELKMLYPTQLEFDNSLVDRENEYASYYTHIKEGRKWTKEEKIDKKIADHTRADEIMYNTLKPIDKVIFLYENKNTQEIKEYCVTIDMDRMNVILDSYEYLNDCVENKILPDRISNAKSQPPCKWCNYKNECFVV